MKELTIEQKAKRYDEAFERAKSKIKNDKDHVLYEDDIIELFPEIAESEDEKTRKEITTYLKSVIANKGYRDEIIESWIAWLEKQRQEPEKVSIWKHWKDGVAGNEGEKVIYLVKKDDTYRLTSCLAFECDYIELSELDGLMFEKQGEQKSADKVKPNDYSSIDPYFGKPIDNIDDDIVVTDKEE